MHAEPVLETAELTVRFGGVAALADVDFRLAERELRCLIGPNGAGKSTFFKCLTGMLAPSAGEVYIRGERTTGWPPHAVAGLGVGIKTQVPSVMNGLSVRENVWLAARRVADGPRRADEEAAAALERLGIADLAGEPVGRLAHGKRQLVEFALVVAARPWLILLDEPAAGLTAEEVERTADVLRELNRTATLVVVEHDMHFIRMIAERVTVFHQGRVLVEEHVDAALDDPRVRDVYLGAAA